MKSETQNMSFTEVLSTLEGGETVREIRNALDSCVCDVLSTGNAGAVTLTLNVKRASSGQVVITDAVKLSPPKRNKDGNIFFRHPEGGLTRTNPDQFSLKDLNKAGE